MERYQEIGISIGGISDLSALLNTQENCFEKLVNQILFDESLRFKGDSLLSQSFDTLLTLFKDWMNETSQIHHQISWNNLGFLTKQAR